MADPYADFSTPAQDPYGAIAIPAPGGSRKPVGAAMAVQNPRPEIGPGPRTSQMPDPARPWGEVLGEAARNFLPDLAHTAIQTTKALTVDLPQTATGVYELGRGLLSKATPGQAEFTPSGTGRPRITRRDDTPDEQAQRSKREAVADAVGQHYADSYGSVEGFKNTLATRPAGVLMDVATVGTAGGALPGKVGEIAARVGRLSDPMLQAGNVLKGAGERVVEPLVSNALGMTTGAGKESVRAAGRAGREGGEVGKAFRENMSGAVPIEHIVDLAKSGLEKIRQERAAAYKEGKVDLSKDKTVLDFQDIDRAVYKSFEVGTYKGQTTEPKARAVTMEMVDTISGWKKLDPADFHTPEGLDALKRTLGNIRDSTQYGSPERVAANRIYNAVRDEVAAQAPAYSKMMEDYARASDKIKEVTRTFTLGEKATGDTAARKLQSATRDGAQTSWRKRGELLNELGTHEPTLPYAIAGQSLNALPPRGLVARGSGMLAAGGAAGSILANPLNALMLTAFSPRIVGEVVYYGGKAVGAVEDVAKAMGITPARLRALELGGYQAGENDNIATRAGALRETNALRAR